jgi:hypothetical protein
LGGQPENTLHLETCNKQLLYRTRTMEMKIIEHDRRVCLIKTMLYSIFLYYVSIFLMLKKVARVINLIKRRFLWSGDPGVK